MDNEPSTVRKGDLPSIVTKINEEIAAIRNEGGLISRYSPSSGAQIQRVYLDTTQAMASIVGPALSDENEARRLLLETLDSLQKGRSRCLRDFLVDIVPKAKKRILQSFWLQGQVSYLSELSTIEESLKKAEWGKPKDTVVLSTCLSEFDNLLSRIEDEKKMTRFRGPLRIVLWGLPIWIGIVLSGRFGLWGNFFCLLAIFLTACVAFLASNRKVISLRKVGKKAKVAPVSFGGRGSGLRRVVVLSIVVTLGTVLVLIQA